MNPSSKFRSALILLIASVSGCGGSSNPEGVTLVQAKGKILVDGKPVAGLSIQLNPRFDWKSDAVPYPHATTDQDGSFLLETFRPGDGAVSGDYEVTITSPSSEGLGRITDPIGLLYADPTKSGLTAKILDSDTTIPDFQLKGNTVDDRIQKSLSRKKR